MIKYPSKQVIKQFQETVGAMSVVEGISLYNICLQAPDYGNWVELGSHKGRSSVMIASCINEKIELSLVEPEFSKIEWANEVANKLQWLNKNRNIVFWANYSTEILDKFNEISFCFVDSGTHSDSLVMNESKMLEDKIISGGVIAYHDKGSQFTKVDEAYNYLLSTGKYEEIIIDWDSIFKYVKENNLQDGELSWHKYPELPHPPNFIGALRRK